MQLGEVVNAEAAGFGQPLDGVRILAAEQMQSLPFATQLLGRLGAEVVKVEHPVHGESGRGAYPAMADPDGRAVGATFLRNNFNKRSVGIDLKSERGRELFLELATGFDVVAENFKAGTMERLGLGYETLAAADPRVIVVSISGFGNRGDSPYQTWPAYAAVVEAMSGIYEWARRPGEAPRANPVGALGDISSALFATIGILAALRHRESTGRGQYVDIAMLDALTAMTDVVTNLWSLGVRPDNQIPLILDSCEATDGYVVTQIVREHQFERLAELVGHPEWVDDPRFAERSGWLEHLDDVIRPALEQWLSTRTKLEAARQLTEAGIAAGAAQRPSDVVADPHLEARDMLVSFARTDGVDEPVLVPGNPVKMSNVAQGPERRVPWLGEHTDAVLTEELGLGDDEIDQLRRDGIVA